MIGSDCFRADEIRAIVKADYENSQVNEISFVETTDNQRG